MKLKKFKTLYASHYNLSNCKTNPNEAKRVFVL